MPRKTRIEIEGGLYHVITRGNDRKNIFHAREDHDKFLQLLNTQKNKLPFYLYAYCLMTNRLHLLIERREDDIGRIMRRVLTGYTQKRKSKYRMPDPYSLGKSPPTSCCSTKRNALPRTISNFSSRPSRVSPKKKSASSRHSSKA